MNHFSNLIRNRKNADLFVFDETIIYSLFEHFINKYNKFSLCLIIILQSWKHLTYANIKLLLSKSSTNAV